MTGSVRVPSSGEDRNNLLDKQSKSVTVDGGIAGSPRHAIKHRSTRDERVVSLIPR
jgi:hypothetical protein